MPRDLPLGAGQTTVWTGWPVVTEVYLKGGGRAGPGVSPTASISLLGRIPGGPAMSSSPLSGRGLYYPGEGMNGG